jgi:Lhr-like helicase
MDVFDLRQRLVGDYSAFARSFTTIRAADIRQALDAEYNSGRFWPDPLISVNPRFQRGPNADELAASAEILPSTAKVFRLRDVSGEPPVPFHMHQSNALAIARQGRSFVVTTGTGSGKSLCYFLPIVDAILRDKTKDAAPRTRAIVVYPMNALANSQAEEIGKFLRGTGVPLTVRRLTGQEKGEQRDEIAANPPDILLTNFMMLELLLVRQSDRDKEIIAHCQGLEFLVLDELHTYRGRQGSDVGLLIRRLRQRTRPRSLVCIGTSATMTSEGPTADRNKAVAEVSSRLFATAVQHTDVITEDLEFRTEQPRAGTQMVDLGPIVKAGWPARVSNEKFRTHPLAIWLESQIGIQRPADGLKLERARPKTLKQVSELLAQASGQPEEPCTHVVKELLLAAVQPERDRIGDPSATTDPFFAFKLHQFFSGAGTALATLQLPAADGSAPQAGERRVTLEAQRFLPGSPGTLLYPTHFCRLCGQEFHPVIRADGENGPAFLPRALDDTPPVDPDDDHTASPAFGLLTPAAGLEFADHDEDYPEDWLEQAAGGPRLKADFRRLRAKRVEVRPDGTLASGGVQFWFLPGKHRFCPQCRASHASMGRDANRLGSLSMEGRSSATTQLTLSTLRWMHERQSPTDAHKRKMLGFSDNRQDAALQAGHFNDFVFVTLLRAAQLRALAAAPPEGLEIDDCGKALAKALGFDRRGDESLDREWMVSPGSFGPVRNDAERALREVMTYRMLFDQRRGWRLNNPNLEQLNLLRVEYVGLEELVARVSWPVDAPHLLADANSESLVNAYRMIFEHMRTGLAIAHPLLSELDLQPLVNRSRATVRTPWGFGADERPRLGSALYVRSPSNLKPRDRDLVLAGGLLSRLGRKIRTSDVWGQPVGKVTRADYEKMLTYLLEHAGRSGYLDRDETSYPGFVGWRLQPTVLRFKPGSEQSAANAFFSDLYRNVAVALGANSRDLFTLEAREHTAQVDRFRRESRERRFRYGDEDQEALATTAAELREVGERDTFLPVMFCSPTMELGVDISSLNMVFMRNVPPTPANYAQRSGRAGRSGQAALVVTYCAALSPHDQWYFSRRDSMVYGQVHAPFLDLANRDLVVSHLHAVWLSESGYDLDPDVAKSVDLDDPTWALVGELRDVMQHPDLFTRSRRAMQEVLSLLQDELNPTNAPWFVEAASFSETVAREAAQHFNSAFDRWRAMYRSALSQRDEARRVMDNHTLSQRERESAKRRHAQALDQLDLLREQRNHENSDFFSYRYLATEGFLPGYNFPRLPLTAFVPSARDKGGTFLQRARFLGLSEFGPRSLVYHEGRAYRVVRVHLGATGEATGGTLRTRTMRMCGQCGAAHFDEAIANCHHCGNDLTDSRRIRDLYRIEQLGTQPADRISANDEERQRQGFEILTSFELNDTPSGTTASQVQGIGGERLARIVFSGAATLLRVNLGLRRRRDRANSNGFKIDPQTGYWKRLSEDDDDAGLDEPGASTNIVPFVEDRKNALLWTYVVPEAEPLSSRAITTIQHALKRGIEAVCQVEESELQAEPLPTAKDRRSVLLYESAEGGAGVLNRIANDTVLLRAVAQEALRIMHFDLPVGQQLPATADQLVDVPGTQCVAGCYRCLLSYYNQPDHPEIDRQDGQAKSYLLRLASAEIYLTARAVGAVPTLFSAGALAEATVARVQGLCAVNNLPVPTEALLGDAPVAVWNSFAVALRVGLHSDSAADAAARLGLELQFVPATAEDVSLLAAIEHLVGAS